MIAGSTKRVWESLTLMWTVVTSPRRAYSRIESVRPFALVWIIGGVLVIVQAFTIFNRVGVDAIMRSGLAERPELKYNAAQLAVMKRNIESFFRFQTLGSTLLWILMIVIITTVLFEVDKRLFGNQRSYKTVLSIVSYAQVPQIFFSLAVCLVLWSYPGSSQFSVNALVGTHPGLLVNPGSVQQFYRTILSSLDVWTLWSIALIAIGLSSERTRVGKTFSYVCGLWAIYVVGKATLSAVLLQQAVAAAQRTGVGK